MTGNGSHQVERINDSVGGVPWFAVCFRRSIRKRKITRRDCIGFVAMEMTSFANPSCCMLRRAVLGHGRNDLALGPDGKIYMIHGDAVDLPENCIDYTSPFREARRGRRTREGHLLRINPDGGPVELLAAGLRNPFGIDFNVDGEVFTYDADAEYDMGAPWYRPTRVNHLVCWR